MRVAEAPQGPAMRVAARKVPRWRKVAHCLSRGALRIDGGT